MDTNEMIALLLPPNGCYKCSDTRKEIAEELARRAAAQPVAWATPSLLVTLSAVEKNHLTNPDRRTRGGEFESAARDAERYSVPLYAAPPAQAEPQEGDLLHTMMEWARTEEGRKQLADSYRPHLWACAKRVADPQNEAATCRHWCGDIEHCQPIASAPAQAEPRTIPAHVQPATLSPHARERPMPDAEITDDTRAELLPCPFCGSGNTQLTPGARVWTGMKYSASVSYSVRHWCAAIAGQPSRMIERIGRDRESAIAAWNTRAALPAERTRCAAIARAAGREDIAQEIEGAGE